MQQCCAESASKHQWCFIVIRYCSQACSVAAKATAFCTCIFIPKLWLCCHIFHQILVELHCHWAPLARFLFPAACPQQTANGTFLDHTMCKVWSGFYPDLTHWHSKPSHRKESNVWMQLIWQSVERPTSRANLKKCLLRAIKTKLS